MRAALGGRTVVDNPKRLRWRAAQLERLELARGTATGAVRARNLRGRHERLCTRPLLLLLLRLLLLAHRLLLLEGGHLLLVLLAHHRHLVVLLLLLLLLRGHSSLLLRPRLRLLLLLLTHGHLLLYHRLLLLRLPAVLLLCLPTRVLFAPLLLHTRFDFGLVAAKAERGLSSGRRHHFRRRLRHEAAVVGRHAPLAGALGIFGVTRLGAGQAVEEVDAAGGVHWTSCVAVD